MKSLIIYQTLTGNTIKVAEAIALVLEAELIRLNSVIPKNLSDYDLIGLGSGIYSGKHHQQILQTAKHINPKQKVFIFSTAGLPVAKFFWHRPLRKILVKNKVSIVGDYSCRGHDQVGPLKRFGGINKNCPNKKDLRAARTFADSLKKPFSLPFDL